MKRKSICLIILLLLLLCLFSKIKSMQLNDNEIDIESFVQKPIELNLLNLPDEVKLYILEQTIRYTIENNSIYEPYNNIKKIINNINLVHYEFYNFRYDLARFAKNYVKEYFAKDYINLTQKTKNLKLKKMIESAYCPEVEIEAAKLIIAGADPNLLVKFDNQGSQKSILLAVVSDGSFKKLINLLIKYGADINIKDDHGLTALMIAADKKREDVVKLFIKHENIDVNAQDNTGWTALMFACHNGHSYIVLKLLKNKNININLKTTLGNSALMIACHGDDEDIIKALLNNKDIDVNAINNNGDTALKIAMLFKHKPIIKLLSFHNASFKHLCNIF